MKFNLSIAALAFLTAFGPGSSILAQEIPEPGETEQRRLAQTGMKFLSMSVDPRAAAMADAVAALDGTSISMFYNPAGMASLQDNVHVAGGQVNFIADINYNAATAAYRPAAGRFGVFGLSIVSVDYGDFYETIRVSSSVDERGFIELSTFSPTAIAAGFGYANAVTDRFSVGANVKYVNQNLGSSVMEELDNGGFERQDFARSTAAFDFGIFYRTGFRSLNFAMSVRNFSREITYADENFELPLTFQIAAGMDLVDLTAFDPSMHSLLVAFEAQRPRDYDEQIKMGMEYTFLNTLALRGGYIFPTDEQGISLGVGLMTQVSGFGFGFHYSYSDFGRLGNVNRLGVELSL